MCVSMCERLREREECKSESLQLGHLCTYSASACMCMLGGWGHRYVTVQVCVFEKVRIDTLSECACWCCQCQLGDISLVKVSLGGTDKTSERKSQRSEMSCL